MKQFFLKILLLAVSVCMMLTSLPSCAKGGKNENKTTDSSTDTIASDEGYDFPDRIEFSDGKLDILNFDGYYNAICYIEPDDTTTNVGNAVYSRNMQFESMYGIQIAEDKVTFQKRTASFNELTSKLMNANLANDDLWDIVYVSLYDQPSVVTSGILRNLNEVSTLNLGDAWWDEQLSDSYMLDEKCYMASSSMNLMPYEMSFVILFNQEMARTRELPNLFDYVRAGEWTVETMLTLVQQYEIISPNADGGYKFEQDGLGTYGCAVHHQSPSHFLFGFDINFVQSNEDGDVPYVYGCSNQEYFSKASDLLLKLFDRTTGMAIGSDYEDDVSGHPEGYVPVFGSGRSLFLNCELKSGMTLKRIFTTDVSLQYGILPMPKLFETQRNYITDMSNSTMMFAIPAVARESEAIGMAADVLSYMSSRDVIPVYYGDYVSYRNANDVESLEMLNTYIMPNRRRDKGIVYGWTTELTDTYDLLIYTGQSSGSTTLANILTQYSRKINAAIRSLYGK